MKLFILIPILVLLASCGSSDKSKSEEKIKTGVFIDSPVANLNFRTESQSGKTNTAGEFNYKSGEMITFSIGSFDFPSTLAKALLTPLDLVGTENINDVTVIKIARLLQSLDLDGDPDNGITIGDEAHTILESLQLDLETSSFYDDVEGILADSGSSNDSLVDETEALAHLQNSLDRVNDNTPPVITLSGSDSLTITQGGDYIEQGASAVDNVDGALSVTTSGVVDTSTVGTYTITYSATDQAGNAATETRTVIVDAAADTEAPVITLNGDSTITITQGGEYTEQGASAEDAVDGTVNVDITGQVISSTVGTYVITYIASDSSSNTATTERTVIVVEAVESETPPGVTVGDVQGNTATVNAAAVFDVYLESQPSADVIIPLSSSNEAEGLVEQSQLTFTSGNWNQPQTVIVRGANESVVDGVQDYTIVLGAIQSDDTDYSGLNPDDVLMKGIHLDISVEEESYNFVVSIENTINTSKIYTGTNDLVYSLLEGAPSGLEIDSSSGTVTWLPNSDNEGNEYPIEINVTDGVLNDTLSIVVEVAASVALDIEVLSNILTVVDSGSNLSGLAIETSNEEVFTNDFTVSSIPKATELGVDEDLVMASDFFVVKNEVNDELKISLPLNESLSSVPLHLIRLYRLIEHEDETFWSPIGHDIEYSEDQEGSSVKVLLENLSGVYFVGYESLDNDSEITSEASVATYSRTLNIHAFQSLNDVFSFVSCSPDPEVGYFRQVCTVGDLVVTVLGAGPSKDFLLFQQISLPEIVSWVESATKGFNVLSLDYDKNLTLSIHAFTQKLSSALAYVSSDDKRTLHINKSLNFNKPNLISTIAHELMHHVQLHEGNLKNTSEYISLGYSDNKARNWFLEGSARWFEDIPGYSFIDSNGQSVSYDSINSYISKEGFSGERILEVGLASIPTEDDKRKRSYSRYSFFKMISERCNNFDTVFQEVLSWDRYGAGDGLGEFAIWLDLQDCDFKNTIPATNFSTNKFSSALAFYQYATQLRNDMSLLDSNELVYPSGINFKKPLSLFDHNNPAKPSKEAATVTEWLEKYPNKASKLTIDGGNSIPPAGAKSFIVPALDASNNSGTKAALKISSDQPLKVSVVSKSKNFKGNSLDNEYKSYSFSVPASEEFEFKYEDILVDNEDKELIPELFVSLINPSITEKSENIKVNFTLCSSTIPSSFESWDEVCPVVTDPQGDQNGNSSTDLISLRAARMNNDLVLMMETSGNILFPHTPSQDNSHYEVGIHFYSNKECSQSPGFLLANSFTLPPRGDETEHEIFHNLYNSITSESYGSSVYYYSNKLVTSIDLSLLPSGMHYVSFNPYIQSFSNSGSDIMHDNAGYPGGSDKCFKLPL